MLQGFDASVHDAMQDKLDERGQPTGEQAPVKLLRISDSHSGTSFGLIFAPEQFERFAQQMRKESSSIIAPLPESLWTKRWQDNGD
jgi:hypothetical protein